MVGPFVLRFVGNIGGGGIFSGGYRACDAGSAGGVTGLIDGDGRGSRADGGGGDRPIPREFERLRQILLCR